MPMATGRVSIRLTLSSLMIVLVAVTTACSGGVTAPDQTSPLSPLSKAASVGSLVNGLSEPHVAVVPLGRFVADYDLGNGSFTLTTVDGDISGGYTGHASVSSYGRTNASLALHVTSGTNVFQGATGSLTGDGAGAFVGEGSFSVSLRGSISTTADPVGFHIRGTASGTSSISCVAQAISVRLQGDGSFGKLSDVHAVLTHLVVGSAGCS